jgi:hypothetical protein
MFLILALVTAGFGAVQGAALPLVDETVTVPAADWRGIGIPLRQRGARLECEFAVRGGEAGVRVMLLDRAELERMSAGRAYRLLAATAYQRSGGFTYAAPPGDYAMVLDNRMEGRGAARVRLRVTLVFDEREPAPRTISPERRAVVVALSVLFLAGVVGFAASRARRLGRRRAA